MVLNEKGWALPLVILIMVVATLLGTALWQYSMVDLKHAKREESKMQAHYYARSGAELVAKNLDQTADWGEVPVGANQAWVSTEQSFNSNSLSENIEIKVYKEGNSDEYVLVESTATVGDTSETLIVEVYNDGSLFWRK